MYADSKIIELIQQGKWTKLLKLIRKKKLDPDTFVNNYNSVTKVVTQQNITDIILYIAKNYSNSLISNGSCYHIIIDNINYDLLTKCINLNPSVINIKNANNESILHYLIKNINKNDDCIDCASNIVNKYNNIIDYKIINNDNETILHILCNKYCLLPSTKILKLLKVIINNSNYSVNYPKKNLPLIYIINLPKKYLASRVKLIKLLIKFGANVNAIDSNYASPLIVSVVINNYIITKILCESGAKVNYQGPYTKYDPMMIAIGNSNNKIVSLLLKAGYNCNMNDNHLNNAAHIALTASPPLPLKTIFKILLKSDLCQKNINGKSPLSLIKKNYNYNYNYNYDVNLFSHLLKEKNINITNSDCDEKNFTNINLKYYSPTNMAIFMSTALFNMIYTILLLKKYSSLCIPFQYYIKDKYINDIYELDLNCLDYSNTIYEIVNTYAKGFNMFLPHIILWKSSKEYYIHPDLIFYLKKCMISDSTRFIMIKISLVPITNATHANILIIDKKTGITNRFDPYGYTPILDTHKLDNFLEKIITKSIGDKLNIKYLHNDSIGLQTISQDDDIRYKKVSDPVGYCLAWVIWYVELRINNPDIHPNDLIKGAIKMILATIKPNNNLDNDDNIMVNVSQFGNYIRNYANTLDIEKNIFLKSAGINYQDYYNNVFTDNDYKKIINKINDEFINNIVNRYYK